MSQEIKAKDGSGGIPRLYDCPGEGILTLKRNDFGLIGVKTSRRCLKRSGINSGFLRLE